MKKTIFSIIVIIIAAGAVIGLTIWSKKHVPVASVTNPVTTSDESKYLVTKEPRMVSVAEDSYLFGIGGSYPQFAQADAGFNKKIADTITAGIADFKTSVNTDYKARLETGGDDFAEQFEGSGVYTYEVTTDIVQSNDNYISAIIRIAGFSGGAHGFRGMMTFNYDVKKQQEISITNFLSLADVSTQSRAQLKKHFQDDGSFDTDIEPMMNDGTDPSKSENFESFTFIPENLTVYFSEYQVAPYVFGEQVVTIDLIK